MNLESLLFQFVMPANMPQIILMTMAITMVIIILIIITMILSLIITIIIIILLLNVKTLFQTHSFQKLPKLLTLCLRNNKSSFKMTW